jgi:predicted Zn-dependent peptidase
MHKASPAATPVSASSTLGSRYQKTILPNGIRIVTEEIPYVRSVSLGAWLDVGSRDENEQTNGISHFVEHMVFKGTDRFSAREIARSMEAAGGYLNAFTTKEHTCYYARALDAHLHTGVQVISELVQHPVFSPKDIEKEKNVVIEELKNIEDDPDDLIHDYFDRNVYQKHPLGFPVIGSAQNIRNFNRHSLMDHLQTHYTPKTTVVAAAGNLKHETLVELVDRSFQFKTQDSNRSTSRVSGPRHMRSKSEVYERPITQAHVCLGTLGCSVRSRQRYPMLVLNTLLGEGMSSRLFQNIREKYGFAYTVYSFANMMSDAGNFGAYIGTDVQNIENSIDLIFKEFEKVRAKPISAAELKRTKAQIKGTMMLSLESMSNRMMRLGSGELFYGEFFPIDTILRSIDAVTIEDVQELANKLLRQENFSTVIIRPNQSPGSSVSVAA